MTSIHHILYWISCWKNRNIVAVCGLSLLICQGCSCSGSTPVFTGGYWTAINDGDVAEVERLIKRYPDVVHLENPFGDTGLHEAIESQEHEVVRVLLAAGADVHHESPRSNLPLNLACSFSDVEMVRILVEEGGADVERQNRHQSGAALKWAAIQGDYEMVKYLIDHGAEVNSATSYGGCPLYWAVFSPSNSSTLAEAILYLLDHGGRFEEPGAYKPVTEKDLYRRAEELGLQDATLARLLERVQEAP